jgi:hypothetical protein
MATKRKKKSARKTRKKKSARKSTRKSTARRTKPLDVVVNDRGKTADDRGKLFSARLGHGSRSIELGTLVARTKTDAKRKFQRLACRAVNR